MDSNGAKDMKTIERIDDFLIERNPEAFVKAPKWEEVRTGVYGVRVEIDMTIKAKDMGDAEWLALDTAETIKKHKNKKFVSIGKMSVPIIDEDKPPKKK